LVLTALHSRKEFGPAGFIGKKGEWDESEPTALCAVDCGSL
jgi:hypothetical protein